MINSNKNTFEQTMLLIQTSYYFKDDSTLGKFLEKCFADLCMRSLVKDGNSVTKNTFVNFLNLPILVGDKIFKVFEKIGQEGGETSTNNSEKVASITKENFIEGMHKLFFGSLKILLKIVFDILDFASEGRIRILNVLLIFSYLNPNKNANSKTASNSASASSEVHIENIESKIFQFFNGVDEINFGEFKNTIIQKNSDLFFIFLYLIYSRQPFTEEGLKFFKENFISSKKNSLINDEAGKKIFDDIDNEFLIKLPLINFELLNVMKFDKNKSILKKETSKFVNYFNLNMEIEVKLNLQEKKFNSNSTIHNNNENMNNLNNRGEDESRTRCESAFQSKRNSAKIEKVIYEAKAFKMTSMNKLTKYKIVLIDNVLFCFRFSQSRNLFVMEDVYPLNGYYPTSLDEIKILEIPFFPIAFLDQFGNTTVNLTNLFFFKEKSEIKTFHEKIRSVMNIREMKNSYELMSDIGKGQFGKVKLGVEKSSGQKVAVKVMEKKKMKSKDIELVRAEIDVMKFLMQNGHDNVVQVFDVLEDRNAVYIVLEYCPYGTLENYLNRRSEVFEEKEVKVVVEQVANGIRFLHKFGIVHRDLKPDNILISGVYGKNINNSNNQNNQNNPYNQNSPSKHTYIPSVKISDFGLSKVLGVNETTNEGYGTLVYAAPEILRHSLYSNKVDVWSFGVILYYLVNRDLPFDGKDLTMNEIAQMICHSPLKFKMNNSNKASSNPNHVDINRCRLSLDVKELLTNCLNKTDIDRFDIEQVLSSKYFA